jgi:hypothetical protein
MICEQLIQLPDGALLSPEQWRPYPRGDERQAWQALPEAERKACIEAGERLLGEPWPFLPATEILAFRRDGNRLRFQEPYFARRQALVSLILAECCEGRGRFLDEIINGIWCICEETSWCLPAHVGGAPENGGLPDPLHPVVDLFAAETGSLLAWTLYLLEPGLGRCSYLLPARLRREIETRIIEPALAHDDYWWMGLTNPAKKLNNWTPWIVSNWLACALLTDNHDGRRAASLYKAAGCLDHFLVLMPADGGCDEGPSYWGRAGASVLDGLELLKSVSGGRLTFYQDPLIRALGRYIVAVHIAGDWFVNFADAGARLKLHAHSIYGYGVRTDDAELMQLGAFLGQQRDGGGFGSDLNRALQALFRFPIASSVETPAPCVRDAWLPDTELVAARDRAGAPQGWFVAAKGGHNGESHNHNDIGTFIVFRDGAPLLVDAGVGEYTRQTFGPERYTLWTMRSAYHNLLPVFDGVEQQPGRAFRARHAAVDADDDRMRFTLDIQEAYPPEAGLKRWRREITLLRGDHVTVTDAYELTADAAAITLLLLTPSRPEIAAANRVRLLPQMLPGAVASAGGWLTFSGEGLKLATEEIPIEDSRLSPVWGRRLHALRLVLPHPARVGSLQCTIQAPEGGSRC